MGGGGATTTIVRRSESDLKKDLFKKASANARKLLKEKTGKDLPEGTDLDDVMRPLAEWRFKEEYAIDWEKDGAQYKTKGHLPEAIDGTIVSTSQLCNIDADSNIDGYVETVLLSKIDCPKWMAEDAKVSLATLAKKLTAQDTQLETRYNAYQRSFDGKQEDDASWRAKAVVVYMRGSLLENSVKADVTIIYFLGSYYKTNSPTRSVRLLIDKNAYTAAKTHTKASQDISQTSELKMALDLYAKNTFKTHFKFDHDSATPPLCMPGAANLHGNSSHFFYFQDLQPEHLDENVERFLFKDLNFPKGSQNMREQAEKDVKDHLKAILKDIDAGSWDDSFIDQTYEADSALVSPVRMNAIFVKYYGHQSTKENVTVACTYIHVVVVLWEREDADTIIKRDMFKILNDNLRPHIQGVMNMKDDKLAMEANLHTFGMKRWEDSFGFKYTDKAPDATSNPVRTKGDHACKDFDMPIKKADLDKWLKFVVFGRDLKAFGHAQSEMTQQIGDELEYFLEDISTINMWDDECMTETYRNPGGDEAGKPIKVNTLYLFARASMTEAGKSQERIFVYVLMYARTVNN